MPEPIALDAIALAEPARVLHHEAATDRPELVIRPRPGWVAVDWGELFRHRELLYFLTWRDVKVRYKQTTLGVAWVVLQPLFTLLIFSVIFGRFAKIPSDGFPYPVYVFAGLLPWMFFASGISNAGTSLVNQQALVTKIYFPRIFIPSATIFAFLIDLAISAVLYAIVLAFYGVMPSWQVVFLPPLVLLTLAATLGIGFILASVTIVYRDVRHLIPFIVQILMYVSPVIYPVRMLPARYRLALALNPMFGIIDGYRSAILGVPWDFGILAVSSTSAVLLLIYGLYSFRRMERRFADLA